MHVSIRSCFDVNLLSSFEYVCVWMCVCVYGCVC
jgi:hypothetical protein